MFIHAHVRKEAFPVDTGVGHVEFEVNEKGHVIAEVTEQPAIDVLLGIPEAYCEYAEDVPPKVSYVIANGEETLDLATLDDAQLRVFAKDNGVTLHYRWVGDKIRQTIIEAFSKPPAAE